MWHELQAEEIKIQKKYRGSGMKRDEEKQRAMKCGWKMRVHRK